MYQSSESSKFKNGITAIIPIASNFSDLDSMKQWLGLAITNGIEIIMVRDSFSHGERECFDNVFRHEICNDQLQVLDVAFHSPGLSRNAGMKLALTQWITFWDCDDIPEPANILEEINAMPQSADFLIGQFSINGALTSTHSVYDIAFNPGNWRIVYRRSKIVDLSYAKESWGEDQLFIIESRLFNSNLVISPKRFYDYQVGNSSQLTANKKNATSLFKILKKALFVTLEETTQNQVTVPQLMMMIRMSITLLNQSVLQRKVILVLFATKLNIHLLYKFHSHYLIALYKVLLRKAKN
jgi:glycosyltransferase involved in cell wall biosynthesis